MLFSIFVDHIIIQNDKIYWRCNFPMKPIGALYCIPLLLCIKWKWSWSNLSLEFVFFSTSQRKFSSNFRAKREKEKKEKKRERGRKKVFESRILDRKGLYTLHNISIYTVSSKVSKMILSRLYWTLQRKLWKPVHIEKSGNNTL